MNPVIKIPHLKRGDTIRTQFDDEELPSYGLIEYAEVGRDDEFTPYHVRIRWLDQIISNIDGSAVPFLIYNDLFEVITKEEFLKVTLSEIGRIYQEIESLLR